ncbi:uncharacterized protein BDR25DRAFT_156552, partial [Lindgomyces ingoldianus]
HAICLGYSLTTPISISIALGLRTTYNPGSFTATAVSGGPDSISAGILIYTGLVEFHARDFLFDPRVTRNLTSLVFKIACLLLGAGIVALLGNW